MPKEKPSCADYIIATIRATRPERKGLKSGTSVGKALRFVFALVSNFYTEEEFRQDLQALLDDGKVLLVTEAHRAVRLGDTSSWDHEKHLKKLPCIPPNAHLNEGWWYLDEHGEPVAPPRAGKDYTPFSRLCLYVVEDGLPARIAEFMAGGISKAEQIMASLQE